MGSEALGEVGSGAGRGSDGDTPVCPVSLDGEMIER